MSKTTFYEFFSGGGMARAGLGKGWDCIFANDICAKKGHAYQKNWGSDHLTIDNIKNVTTEMLPSRADLSWASFPCQDLSLAGNGEGLNARRSGTFWDFWSLMVELKHQNRAPKLIVLENVIGALTSHNGDDFRCIVKALSAQGYMVSALVVDAELFVPQSRPRLFIIGILQNLKIPQSLLTQGPELPWHTKAMQKAICGLSQEESANWCWFSLPQPTKRVLTLSDVIEQAPLDVTWNSQEKTNALLAMMTEVHLAKIAKAKKLSKRSGKVVAGTLYRRTRQGVQRAEVRFDGVSGCLRTPKGGSSRQTIVIVDGDNIRTRLISARETARLMGLVDSYVLPKKYNDAYFLTGDGVAVPVVNYIAKHLLNPIILSN